MIYACSTPKETHLIMEKNGKKETLVSFLSSLEKEDDYTKNGRVHTYRLAVKNHTVKIAHNENEILVETTQKQNGENVQDGIQLHYNSKTQEGRVIIFKAGDQKMAHKIDNHLHLNLSCDTMVLKCYDNTKDNQNVDIQEGPQARHNFNKNHLLYTNIQDNKRVQVFNALFGKEIRETVSDESLYTEHCYDTIYNESTSVTLKMYFNPKTRAFLGGSKDIYLGGRTVHGPVNQAENYHGLITVYDNGEKSKLLINNGKKIINLTYAVEFAALIGLSITAGIMAALSIPSEPEKIDTQIPVATKQINQYTQGR